MLLRCVEATSKVRIIIRTIFQVTISCGDVFGDDDPDLCLYSEIFSRDFVGDSGTGFRTFTWGGLVFPA